MKESYKPVFEATRGGMVESVQFGAAAVVSSSGELLASLGDADLVTFMRSSAKPFQALPFIEQGGDKHFGLDQSEVALICASHSGTDQHAAALNRLQEKTGILETQLLCGTHEPFHKPTYQEMVKRNEPISPNRHNCSGKHSGMLAYARLMGYPLEDYINNDHPVQKDILMAFSDMTGVPGPEVIVGIDGCSAPNFAVPLRNAAYAVARLCDPDGLSASRMEACHRISRAMSANGLMVAGPGRFDTVFMDLVSGRMLAKTGAEGYQVIGVFKNALGPGTPAFGMAFKVSDGDLTSRASPMMAVELLREMGALTGKEAQSLMDFDRRPIYNFRKLTVGEYRTCFRLKRYD
jgi:L-asparaginase II